MATWSRLGWSGLTVTVQLDFGSSSSAAAIERFLAASSAKAWAICTLRSSPPERGDADSLNELRTKLPVSRQARAALGQRIVRQRLDPHGRHAAKRGFGGDRVGIGRRRIAGHQAATGRRA